MSSHDELLEGYLAHAEEVAHERKDTNFWAFNELADLMRDDPDGAWQIIVELVAARPMKRPSGTWPQEHSKTLSVSIPRP
jgi:hypothetical protein